MMGVTKSKIVSHSWIRIYVNWADGVDWVVNPAVVVATLVHGGIGLIGLIASSPISVIVTGASEKCAGESSHTGTDGCPFEFTPLLVPDDGAGPGSDQGTANGARFRVRGIIPVIVAGDPQ